MTYSEAVEWLYSLQLHGIRLGLEGMRRLCAGLDIPVGPGPATDRGHDSLEFAETSGDGAPTDNRTGSLSSSDCPLFFHVAGTNGKGSVCAMIDACLREAGWRTGLYTSPHLLTFRERMRIDGEMIGEAEVARGLSEIRGIAEKYEHPPTFFEVTTALALGWFRDQRAHAVVLETGLGGRLDATNVVTPGVSVITPIGLDHQQHLGTTLAQIALEKAGIIKPGVPVVSAPQKADARAVIERVARERRSECRFVEEPWISSKLALAGMHQRWNAAVALTAIGAAAAQHPFLLNATHLFNPAGIERALQSVQWPGRFQRYGYQIVLDGAHNPDAAIRLAETWRREYGEEKATLIFAAMRDKDVAGVFAALRDIVGRVITVEVRNPRACHHEELAAIVRSAAPDVECTAAPDIAGAIQSAVPLPERVLIAGSLFLVGEALSHLEPGASRPERTLQ